MKKSAVSVRLAESKDNREEGVMVSCDALCRVGVFDVMPRSSSGASESAHERNLSASSSRS